MAGMDMMLSSLIGMKPAEIKEAVQKTVGLAEAAAKDMADIKESQLRTELIMSQILDELKGVDTNGGAEGRNGKQRIGNGDSNHVEL